MMPFPKTCVGCTEETGRSSTCHSTCGRYLDARAVRDKEIEEMRKQKQREREALAVEFDCKDKIRRRLYGK